MRAGVGARGRTPIHPSALLPRCAVGTLKVFSCVAFVAPRRLLADWDAEKEDAAEGQQWKDDWDDDDVNGEFSSFLREEIKNYSEKKAAQ